MTSKINPITNPEWHHVSLATIAHSYPDDLDARHIALFNAHAIITDFRSRIVYSSDVMDVLDETYSILDDIYHDQLKNYYCYNKLVSTMIEMHLVPSDYLKECYHGGNVRAYKNTHERW